jgi:SAM-dependent methyltransferase
MTNQGIAWDREYNNKKLVTNKDEPQADTLRFLKFLKKEEKYKVEGRNILDLGSGTGRNANYLAEHGNNVIGIEISLTALHIAKDRAEVMNVNVDYRLGDIGAPYGIDDESIDIVLDITSSNALDEKGREVYLKESYRVLRTGGYMFVRALCKDGNKNVKNLLSNNPGKEADTYVLPGLGITERVFSREDFVKMYSQYFKILKLEKKTNYPTVDGRVYKRDYWIAYLQK